MNNSKLMTTLGLIVVWCIGTHLVLGDDALAPIDWAVLAFFVVYMINNLYGNNKH